MSNLNATSVTAAAIVGEPEVVEDRAVKSALTPDAARRLENIASDPAWLALKAAAAERLQAQRPVAGRSVGTMDPLVEGKVVEMPSGADGHEGHLRHAGLVLPVGVLLVLADHGLLHGER